MAYKILMIPSWFPSGTNPGLGIFFRQQAEALAARGHDVTVLSIHLRSLREPRNLMASGYGYSDESVNGVRILRYVSVGFPDRLPMINAWLWRLYGRKMFRKYLKSVGAPDLIHVHAMIYGGILALHLHDEYGIPYVLTEHSSIYERELANKTHIRLANSIARKSCQNFAVSERFCKRLTKSVGSFNWEYLPNMVGHQFLTAEINEGANKNRETFTFFAVGGLVQHKRFDLLIEAFSLAFKKEKTLFLRVIGDGPEKPRLLNLAKALHVDHRIEFLGSKNTEELIKIAAECDALVHASNYETFGVAIIEALALGKPVISTRCGGPESIVNANVGLLVTVNDALALSEAMLLVQKKRDRYDPVSIRNYCVSHFSSKAIVDRLEMVYATASKKESYINVNRSCT
jgi:glycosyltransferase involved in cell wall biosynthesis